MGLRDEHDGVYIDYMATGDEKTSSRGTNASKYSTSKKSLTRVTLELVMWESKGLASGLYEPLHLDLCRFI